MFLQELNNHENIIRCHCCCGAVLMVDHVFGALPDFGNPPQHIFDGAWALCEIITWIAASINLALQLPIRGDTFPSSFMAPRHSASEPGRPGLDSVQDPERAEGRERPGHLPGV